MKIKLLVISIFFCFTLTANAQKDSISITNHSRELLYLMGSDKLGAQMMNMMVASFKKNIPNASDKFWDEFMKEFSSNDLVELLVPIYAKHYSDDELIGLIKFYKTPLGQKVIEKTPIIAQESFSIGQEWGKKIGEKAVARLREQGYIKE